MTNKPLAEPLIETYLHLPVPDRISPVASDPVYTTIDGTGVSTAFYDEIATRVDFPRKLPDGFLAQVVIDAPSGVHTATAWKTFDQSQAYFRNSIGPATVTVIAESEERGDIVSNEFCLTGLRIGAGAESFSAQRHPSIPETLAVTLEVQVETDDARGHTRAAAFDLIAQIVAAPESMEAREQGLVLDMGGVTVDGFSVLHVWTDGRAARRYYDESIPQMLAEIMPGWKVQLASPRCEVVHSCVVSDELIDV